MQATLATSAACKNRTAALPASWHETAPVGAQTAPTKSPTGNARHLAARTPQLPCALVETIATHLQKRVSSAWCAQPGRQAGLGRQIHQGVPGNAWLACPPDAIRKCCKPTSTLEEEHATGRTANDQACHPQHAPLQAPVTMPKAACARTPPATQSSMAAARAPVSPAEDSAGSHCKPTSTFEEKSGHATGKTANDQVCHPQHTPLQASAHHAESGACADPPPAPQSMIEWPASHHTSTPTMQVGRRRAQPLTESISSGRIRAPIPTPPLVTHAQPLCFCTANCSCCWQPRAPHRSHLEAVPATVGMPSQHQTPRPFPALFNRQSLAAARSTTRSDASTHHAYSQTQRGDLHLARGCAPI